MSYETEEAMNMNMNILEDELVAVKKGKRQYYPSNGSIIVNAVTGTVYPYKVGSKESLCLYHIIDSSGHCDNEGRKLLPSRKTPANREPNHCYYNSPDEYQRHRKIFLDETIVKKWNAMQSFIFPDGEFNQEGYNEYMLSKKIN